MSVRITGIAVVVKRSAVEAGYAGGIARYRVDAPGLLQEDDDLVSVTFDRSAEADGWLEQVAGKGISRGDAVTIDGTTGETAACPWLDYHAEGEGAGVVSLRVETASPSFARFDLLSRSDSGLHYVRERRSGLLRRLTELELEDFNDPRPCPECAEQFGCEHYNCAGEPLLTEAEIESDVPKEWSALARDHGISRPDLERLHSIDLGEGEYRLKSDAQSDMRMLELMLLLNGAE